LLGYRAVVWNVVAFAWLANEPEWMANSVIQQIRPGDIVLFHGAIFRSMQECPQYNRNGMLQALALVLDWARDRFRFVTVPQLLRCGRPVVQDWVSIPPPEYLARIRPHDVQTRGGI
jgi:hypothetical protein